MKKIAPYWKAVIGFAAPAATVLAAGVAPGSDGGTTLTVAEIVTAAAAAVVTAAGVYAKSNAPVSPAKLATPVKPPARRPRKVAAKKPAKKG